MWEQGHPTDEALDEVEEVRQRFSLKYKNQRKALVEVGLQSLGIPRNLSNILDLIEGKVGLLYIDVLPLNPLLQS